MAQSVAQQLTVSMPSPQELNIEPTENLSQAQTLTVTMGTAYIPVNINPAQRLPVD
jgi:hypothetical protein